MSMFPLFSRAHTTEHNDSDMSSLPLHTPWEMLQQPTINLTPTAYWQFDQQQQQPTSQFGVVPEKYYHGQSPWNVPVKNSELELNEEEYLGPINSGKKKALHNARERHRRKTLKVLYSDLRSLLPNQNAKRKLSIPNTVCRALKYIPELRNEIKKLSRERSKLLAATKRSISVTSLVTPKSASITEAEGLPDFMHSPRPPAAFGSPDPIVTVNAALWSSQMIITIYNCRVGLFFSTLVLLLEKEGLDVLDASTFLCEDKVYYNLHLEIIGECKVETESVQNKLLKLLSDET